MNKLGSFPFFLIIPSFLHSFLPSVSPALDSVTFVRCLAKDGGAWDFYQERGGTYPPPLSSTRPTGIGGVFGDVAEAIGGGGDEDGCIGCQPE